MKRQAPFAELNRKTVKPKDMGKQGRQLSLSGNDQVVIVEMKAAGGAPIGFVAMELAEAERFVQALEAGIRQARALAAVKAHPLPAGKPN